MEDCRTKARQAVRVGLQFGVAERFSLIVTNPHLPGSCPVDECLVSVHRFGIWDTLFPQTLTDVCRKDKMAFSDSPTRTGVSLFKFILESLAKLFHFW